MFDITKQQESLTRLITKNIRNDSIAGLLLSKVSRGKELKIEVIIDSQSHLQHLPPHLNEHDFVIILGNLIENSFYALNESDTSLKKSTLVLNRIMKYARCLLKTTDLAFQRNSFPISL